MKYPSWVDFRILTILTLPLKLTLTLTLSLTFPVKYNTSAQKLRG